MSLANLFPAKLFSCMVLLIHTCIMATYNSSVVLILCNSCLTAWYYFILFRRYFAATGLTERSGWPSMKGVCLSSTPRRWVPSPRTPMERYLHLVARKTASSSWWFPLNRRSRMNSSVRTEEE